MSDKIILYHGSYCVVREPDLSRCASGKDFGQGFYLTTSKTQAQRFVATSIKKALTQKVFNCFSDIYGAAHRDSRRHALCGRL